MIVADSSLVCDFLLNAETCPDVVALVSSAQHIVAPVLLQYEAGSVMRALFLRGLLTTDRAHEAFQQFSELRIDYRDSDGLFKRAWDMRHNVSFYDASYVALAETTNLPLYTRDKKLASAPGHHARIILI